MTPQEGRTIRLNVMPERRRRGSKGDVELARLAKALAHPARIAILRLLLTRGDCICGDIVNRVPWAQATVSQHLKVLKGAGWIQGEIDGPRVCYCLRPEAGRKFMALLKELTSGEERSGA